MTLKEWLDQRMISQKHFLKKVQCSRVTMSKILKGYACCPEIADQIYNATNGDVLLPTSNRGRHAKQSTTSTKKLKTCNILNWSKKYRNMAHTGGAL